MRRRGPTPTARIRWLAPTSLIISAFAPVPDARATLTPELERRGLPRLLLWIFAAAKKSPGGSCWAQVLERRDGDPADLTIRRSCTVLRRDSESSRTSLLLAYHDRSDGGVLVTLLEMAVC